MSALSIVGTMSILAALQVGMDFDMAAIEKELMTAVKPLVESKYRVLTDRNNRAIGGLSMAAARTSKGKSASSASYVRRRIHSRHVSLSSA